MNNQIPITAKVVVIGGDFAGCSVAYHLTKFSWKDVLLLERDQLTSGTTWHVFSFKKNNKIFLLTE